MAPRVKVIAGVVVGVATVPETPFAVATEALVTDPVPVPQVGQETAVPDTTMGEVPVMVPEFATLLQAVPFHVRRYPVVTF
jgi:hypothetical protein